MRIALAVVMASACSHVAPTRGAPVETADAEQACANGDRNRCYSLAMFLGYGTRAAPPDDVRAARYFERACTLGHVSGCHEFGLRLAWGLGVPVDLTRAREIQHDACLRGDAASCGAMRLLDGDALNAQCTPSPAVPGLVGGLEKSDIMAVIKGHGSEVKACYERVLSMEDPFDQDVALEWTIGADGAVVAVRITRDTQPDSTVASCIVDRVQRWRFPCPRGGGVVTVTFPWQLRRARDEAEPLPGPPPTPPPL